MTDIPVKTEEQKESEAEIQRIRQRLGPFVVAADTTRMAMIFTDAGAPNHPIIFANDAFLALTGYDREEILGQDFNFLIEDGTNSTAALKIEEEFEKNAGVSTEVFYHRKEKSPIWVALFMTPVLDEEGTVVQHFVSFIDLSVHREGEAVARLLVDELNHRVKNTLATVRSIVSQGLRSSESVETIRVVIEERLFALSRSHDLLARENWRSAGLFDLVSQALKPFDLNNGPGEPSRFVITGKNIRVKPNVALGMGIVFHELATNAVKYGALSNGDGSVEVTWAVKASPADDRLFIRWQETGGPPVTPPLRKGFGTRVIERGVTHELSAVSKLDFAGSGLICTIDMPAPNVPSDHN